MFNLTSVVRLLRYSAPASGETSSLVDRIYPFIRLRYSQKDIQMHYVLHVTEDDLCLHIFHFSFKVEIRIGVTAHLPDSITHSLNAMNNVISFGALQYHVVPLPSHCLSFVSLSLVSSLCFPATHICIFSLHISVPLPPSFLCLYVMLDQIKRSGPFLLLGIKGNIQSLKWE